MRKKQGKSNTAENGMKSSAKRKRNAAPSKSAQATRERALVALPKSKGLGGLLCLYWVQKNGFAEVADFMSETATRYDLDVRIIDEEYKEALEVKIEMKNILTFL